MHIPDDPLFTRSTTSRRATIYVSTTMATAAQASGFRVWKTSYATIGVLICWDQWYPEAARITALLGARGALLPDGDRLASGGEGGVGRGAGRRVADRAARARDRERRVRRVAESRRARGRAGHRRARVLRPFVHRAIRSAACIAEAGTEPAILIAMCDPALIEYTRRNWPFLRDRRIDAYGPILNRYLG